MANIDKFITFVIAHEAGGIKKSLETNMEFFERTRARGWSDKKSDRGGKTQTGLTLATYAAWCKRHGISEPTGDNLAHIPYKTWKEILKELFWDKWKADSISNDSIALMVVDWVWASGPGTIAKVQKLIGTTADGVVGPNTINTLNSKQQITLFSALKQRRVNFLEAIVKNDPGQKVNLKGWMNRLNAITYEE